jgi:uncharacterized membrane protein
VRPWLLLLHNLGFILWIGGSIAAMSIGTRMRQLPRRELAVPLELQGRLLRGMILPGVVLSVLTGLLLTLRLYGTATSVSGYPPALMLMQGAGLMGGALVLVVNLPAMSRLTRLDAEGPHGPLYDLLRRRISFAGMLAGVLALVALAGGVWLR